VAPQDSQLSPTGRARRSAAWCAHRSGPAGTSAPARRTPGESSHWDVPPSTRPVDGLVTSRFPASASCEVVKEMPKSAKSRRCSAPTLDQRLGLTPSCRALSMIACRARRSRRRTAVVAGRRWKRTQMSVCTYSTCAESGAVGVRQRARDEDRAALGRAHGADVRQAGWHLIQPSPERAASADTRCIQGQRNRGLSALHSISRPLRPLCLYLS